MSREDFKTRAPIHQDSLADYETWLSLLKKWNSRINLVAPKSLDQFWTRHALDSAQILPLIPNPAKTIVDFGSGAGFPAIAIAIDAKHRGSERTVHLIESVGKKANFLKTVSRETSLPTFIHAERIETLDPLRADIITARAFAPLERLLPLANRHLADDGQIILLKGSSIDQEIDRARQDWRFSYETSPSLSDESGSIIRLRDLSRL
jgi:16S rRNA (guanine527-N7)-methyltransferase